MHRKELIIKIFPLFFIALLLFSLKLSAREIWPPVYTEASFFELARYGNPSFIDTALAQGINVNATDTIYGRTALHWAVLYKRPEVIKKLLESGAAIEARDTKGRTPLFKAAANYYGTAPIVQLLLAFSNPPGVSP